MVHLSAFADEISADPEEQLACLEANAVRHVELRSIHGTNVLDLSRDQHAHFRDMLNKRGMGISAIGSPIGKTPITDPFEPQWSRFETAMDLANFYGTRRIRIFSFYIPADADPSAHRDEVVRRLRKAASAAESKGLELVLENEKGIYGDTPERVADVIESVNLPSLRHAFDPANYLEIGADVRAAWARVRDHVTHFHVKDYNCDTHKNVPAGAGQGCIGSLIADAVSRGFQGFCVLEPHLIVAEKSYGFTGPVRFGEAANALKSELATHGVDWN